MTEKEIQIALDSMQILADNREHKTEEFAQRCKEIHELTGHKVGMATISAGDYSAIAWDKDGNLIDMRDVATIERKMSLDELASNLTSQKERFEKEFTRAKDKGVKVYLLVENMSFTKLFNGTMPNHPRINKNSVIGAFFTFVTRYRLQPIFCKPDQTARIIVEIMRKELEQHLNPKDGHRYENTSV